MHPRTTPVFIALIGLILIGAMTVLLWPEGQSSNEPVAPDLRASQPEPELEPDHAQEPELAMETPDAGIEVDRIERDLVATQAEAPAGAGVTLRVVDSEGNAIPNAEWIALDGQDPRAYRRYWNAADLLHFQPEAVIASSLTDQNGLAQLQGIPYFVEIQSLIRVEGYAAVEVKFEADDGPDILDLGTIPLGPGAIVEVEVVDDQGAPVVGESLSLSLWEELEGYSDEYPPIEEFTDKTDASGLVRFPYLARAEGLRYGFSGSAMRGGPEIEVVGEVAPEGGRFRITIPASSWVEGTVIDTDGNPVAGAEINLNRPGQWDTEENATPEDLLQQSSGSMLWGSHTSIENFHSTYQSDADGKFRSPLDPPNRFENIPEQFHDLVGVTALIHGDHVVAGNWMRRTNPIVLTVPARYPVSGAVFNSAGEAIPDSAVVFHLRPADGEEPPSREDFDYSQRYEPSPANCDDTGKFVKLLTQGNYWAEVTFPGGRSLFAGPYAVAQATELGTLGIENGCTVELVVTAADPSRKFTELEGSREPQPKQKSESDDESGDLFGGGAKPKPNTPWGDRDYDWARSSSQGSVEGTSVVWRNEPSGDWRYLIQSPGFVPAVADLALVDQSENQRVEISLESCGQLRMRVLQRTGEPASGLTLQLYPADKETMHPMHQILDDSRGVYHRIGRAKVPDQDGVVVFSDLFAGEYVITSEEGEDDDGYVWRLDETKPVLARVTIEAGKTTEFEATLASMAELRVTVTADGQLFAGAEVLAVPWRDSRPRLSRGFGSDQPSGVTGTDGSVLVQSLNPGQRYLVGARVQDESGHYGIETAWTTADLTLETGIQELAIALSTGAVRVQANGNHVEGSVAFTLVSLPEKTEIPADVDPEQRARSERYEWFNARSPVSSRIYINQIASLRGNIGTSVLLENIPPGKYQVVALHRDDKFEARAVSEIFEVSSGVHDAGELLLVQLGVAAVSYEFPASFDEARIDNLSLHCVPLGSDQDAENTNWFGSDNSETWKLPPGDYQLILFEKQRELLRSTEFKVHSGAETEFNWIIPEPK
jgi:hypothetical protein